MSKKLSAVTDGGSRGNPGPAAIGILLLSDGKVILTHKERIGSATNNQAEYRAIIKALELAKKKGASHLECTTDSLLVASQAAGSYRVRNPELQKLHTQLKTKERAFEKVIYFHVRRTHPLIKRADALVNQALDSA